MLSSGFLNPEDVIAEGSSIISQKNHLIIKKPSIFLLLQHPLKIPIIWKIINHQHSKLQKN
jgi:hypothetical protein